MKHICCILMMWFVALTAPAAAQGIGANSVPATLIAETSQPAFGTTTLAIVFHPQPGWHGYWKNPGDAGFSGKYEWALPKGVTVGDIAYPVPEKLVIAGLMNHVFEQEHALIVPLKIASMPIGTRLHIGLHGDWLGCTDKICVPQSGDMAIDLVVGDGRISPATATQFDGWRAKLPRPLGAQAHFAVANNRLRIGVPYPANAAMDDPWFFAETKDAIRYIAPQSIARNGDMLIIESDAAGSDFAQLKGIVRVGGKGLAISAVPGVVPKAAPGGGWRAILLALGGALLGGLILNIMPCVFPIISLKALSLARVGGDEAAAKRESLAYAAGVILTCVAIGGLLLALRAGGAQIGWAFQLQNPYVIFGLLLLAIAITLNLLGLFELRVFGGGEALARQGGLGGAFWTGALAAFVATPCTGPFMAAALGAALVLPTAAALAIFAGLGLGMALPFLALGYIPALRNRIPKPGAWMKTFQRILAIPMALTALALGWLLWQETGGRGTASTSIEAGALGAEAFSESRLADLRAAGRPVFVYFTADWCLTCKVNEKAAIDRTETATAFKRGNVAVLVGDWTSGDPAITRFLNAHGVSGVPLYLFYPGGSDAARALPVTLPQILTPAMLSALAK